MSLIRSFEVVKKLLSAAATVGGVVGGACVVAYLLSIKYLPAEISLGNSLLFLVAAFCFGVFYLFFVACLVGLGMTFSPAIHLVVKMVVWAWGLFSDAPPKQAHPWPKFSWIAPVFAFFALVLILAFGRKEASAYWHLPLLSVAMYFIYGLCESFGSKVRLGSKVFVNERPEEAGKKEIDANNAGEFKRYQPVMLCILFLLPLVMGGVSGQLVEGAMRVSNIRRENLVVYVKEPYASMISSSSAALPGKDRLVDYREFSGVDILFSGLGGNSLLSFPNANSRDRLEIPNSEFVVKSSFAIN